MTDFARDVTTDEFSAEVLDGPGTVLVDFWAPWCAPCRAFLPVVESLAAENAGRARVMKLNVDEESEIANRYEVTSIPSILVFHRGELVARHRGGMPKEALQAFLDQHLTAPPRAADFD